ncbi:hypothetical protein D3C80_1941340 [compost metagenome]
MLVQHQQKAVGLDAAGDLDRFLGTAFDRLVERVLGSSQKRFSCRFRPRMAECAWHRMFHMHGIRMSSALPAYGHLRADKFRGSVAVSENSFTLIERAPCRHRLALR